MKNKYTILALCAAFFLTASAAMAGTQASTTGNGGGTRPVPDPNLASGTVGLGTINPFGNGGGALPVPDPNSKFDGIIANGNGNGTLPVPDPNISSTSTYSLWCVLGLCTQP
ncbi:hypothetical protein [Alteromonas sp. a30]|uniref:hypothetical protein n=1 Tax=Alteromonas sp. a30 TaxID=2730917 RepID=UPI002280DC69|nr:hypothetical protein [Alteromonas sp. a30]MCY7294603.1 hypothetical protein [Alteromonas sp. a30]